MQVVSRRFSRFVNYALRILIFLVLFESFIRVINVAKELSDKNLLNFIFISSLFITGSLLYGYLVYTVLRTNNNSLTSLILILAVSFIVRALWILNIHTEPISDFQILFEYGRRFNSGDYSMFKGAEYIARFPHLTLSVLYYGIFHRFFQNPLAAIKVSNIIWSSLDVYLIYLIVSVIYEDKRKGVWAAFAASIFPPLIMYTSVTCTENHALPFFLFSIYLFIKSVKERKNPWWLILSGFLLFIGHVFRMVGSICIIAFVIYILLYLPIKEGLKYLFSIVISFAIPLYITSNLLMSTGITEYPLWHGREPSSTTILRGTNIDSNGAWNEEDAKIPEMYNYNYKEVDKAAKDIIKKRLTTTPPLKLLKFYFDKFTSEWSHGDFAALYWSTLQISYINTAYKLSIFTAFYSQLFYSMILVLVYIGLFNAEQYEENSFVNLFYILFCGFGLLYLITENQSRYGYIASWIFVVLTFTAIEKICVSELFSRFRRRIIKIR